MIKKTAIIGTHSAGKTTLSYVLAAQKKREGRSVKIIQEVARSCPYPLNEGMTKEACLWIYHEHVKKELEATQKFDTIICDRSALDSFMYAKAQNCFDDQDIYLRLCLESAMNWMKTYDIIIYVEPGSIDPIPDGVRSTDKDFQERVRSEFQKCLSVLDINRERILKITSDDIFDSTNEDVIW